MAAARPPATRPVLGADRIAKFMLGYASKVHWSESDFQLVTINGAPGLLLRHPCPETAPTPSTSPTAASARSTSCATRDTARVVFLRAATH